MMAESMQNMIVLNVGGKEVNIDAHSLNKLQIQLEDLIQIDKTHYFLNRDGFYFLKAVKYKENKCDVLTLSNSARAELVHYQLLGAQYMPAIQLMVSRNENKDERIVTIIVKDYYFDMLVQDLMISTYWKRKIENAFSTQYKINVDPKIFRNVVYLLRHGVSYEQDAALINMLNLMGISYSMNEPYTIQGQVTHARSMINHVQQSINMFEQLSQHKSANYIHFQQASHLTHGNLISTNLSQYTHISGDYNIVADKNIVISLPASGDILNDMILCIDIPEEFDRPNLEFDMIESIKIIIRGQKVLLRSLGQELFVNHHAYQHRIVESYTQSWHDQSFLRVRHVKISLPWFDQHSYLPILKYHKHGNTLQCIIKLNHALINHNFNISLMAEYVHLSRYMMIPQYDTLNKTIKMVRVPHQIELIQQPYLYNYPFTHCVHEFQCSKTQNHWFEYRVDLPHCDMVKDFLLIQHEANTYHGIAHDIIDVSIYCRSQLLHQWDHAMLNQYLPTKYLNVSMPIGYYYASFSFKPKKYRMLGCVPSKGWHMMVRTKTDQYQLTLFWHTLITDLV